MTTISSVIETLSSGDMEVEVVPVGLEEPTDVVNVPMLRFPTLYIIVAAESGKEPRSLEKTSAPDFDAWITEIATEESIDMFFVILDELGINRSQWTLIEKWLAVNALAVNGVDLPKYWHDDRAAAECALIALQETQKVEAVHA